MQFSVQNNLDKSVVHKEKEVDSILRFPLKSKKKKPKALKSKNSAPIYKDTPSKSGKKKILVK